jgi:signal transduction histidine kinase
LWIGTGGGLSEFRAGRFRSYTTQNGLSSNSVWAITSDAYGALWIGTGAGLDRFKSGKFTAYTVHEGLFDNEPIGIVSDTYGNLWLSSNKGVFRVSISELNRYAAGLVTSIHSVSYGTSDGLKSNECNGGFQPAVWRTKNGGLIFPTMRGLGIVDPGKMKTSVKPLQVLIETANIDGRTFDVRRPIAAQPGAGKLEFTFTAPSLVSSEQIEFRYKLVGFDNDWVDAGQRRSAYYTNIAPGTYHFVVFARRPEGVWNGRKADLEAVLRPHFYQTLGFAVGCAMLFCGLCCSVYWLRIRQLRNNETRLISLIDERTHALQEQVGAGVISDKVRDSRVGNLSTAITMLAEHANDLDRFVQTDPKGQKLLPYLAKLADHFKREREQILGELESLTGHIDHIKEIVATQQDYARASPITEFVSVPRIVEQAIRMVETALDRHHVELIREIEEMEDVSIAKHKLLEILVNLIRNAKQAIVQHDGPQRELLVRVKRHGENRVRIEVHDTGVGLSPENVTRIFAHGFTTKQDGHGFGLHSAALSAKQIGGSLWAESPGAGMGATFILEIPATVSIPAVEMSSV